MRHTVTYEEIFEYLDAEVWHHAASSMSRSAHKVLEASNKGMFRVKDHDKIVYYGNSLGNAVDAYNGAP